MLRIRLCTNMHVVMGTSHTTLDPVTPQHVIILMIPNTATDIPLSGLARHGCFQAVPCASFLRTVLQGATFHAHTARPRLGRDTLFFFCCCSRTGKVPLSVGKDSQESACIFPVDWHGFLLAHPSGTRGSRKQLAQYARCQSPPHLAQMRCAPPGQRGGRKHVQPVLPH